MREQSKRRGGNKMLEKNEINIAREKLNKSIANQEDYSKIYKLSVELDKLI